MKAFITAACLGICTGVYLELKRQSTEGSLSKFDQVNSVWELEQDIIVNLLNSSEFTLEDYLTKYSEQIQRDTERMIKNSEDTRAQAINPVQQKYEADPEVFRQMLIRNYTSEYHAKTKEWANKTAKRILIQRVSETYIQEFGLNAAGLAGVCAGLWYELYTLRKKAYEKVYLILQWDHEVYAQPFLRVSKLKAMILASQTEMAYGYAEELSESVLKNIVEILLFPVTEIQGVLCPELLETRTRSRTVTMTLEAIERSRGNERANVLDDIIIDNKSMFYNTVSGTSLELLQMYNRERVKSESMTYFLSELESIAKVFKNAVFSTSRTHVQEVLHREFVCYIERNPSLYRTMFNNPAFESLIKLFKTVRNRFTNKYSRVVPIEKELISLVFGYL